MATIVANSNSYADVNTAVNTTANRGDTVQVPAGGGSVTWTSTLTITKGVFLEGPGRDSLTITKTSDPTIQIDPDSTAISDEETIRIEGFTFSGGNASLSIIKGTGAGTASSKAFKNLAVGNCRFKDMSTTTSGNGVFYTIGQFRGVIYGNIFDRCNVILKINGNDTTTEWSNGNFPRAFGTIDNLYFEGNSILYSGAYSGQDPGWFESGQGGRVVVRYNTFDFNGIDCSEYWDVHGFQNWPSPPDGGQTGSFVVEYYGNTLTNTDGYRWMNLRGGWGLMFNNIMTGANSGAIEINQYADGDSGGSGCAADIVPDATGLYVPEVANSYIFNNTINGTISNMGPGDPIGNGCGTAENTSYWNYNASFGNNQNGIGRGTSAPTTTGNPDGAGYWVCSTSTPTVDPDIVQAGHLYKRVSGAWTDYYTPYTYPHPLQSGSSGSGGTGSHGRRHKRGILRRM